MLLFIFEVLQKSKIDIVKNWFWINTPVLTTSKNQRRSNLISEPTLKVKFDTYLLLLKVMVDKKIYTGFY